ncbi:MAG: phosphotransferase family protein [Thermobispora sp.]|nr:phosphotransferase family protein [Thermobispora sp.]
MNVDPPGLDLTRLAAYLEDQGLTRGPLTAELITGGKSNLTYVVRDATAEYVVRRPPLGHVLATAHDMGREYRVMTALRDTPVPVPRTYHLCTDPEVIGAPFYVMEHVAGERPPMTPALAHELIDVLAALHSIPPESVGLADFGRPDGYLERQVRRWKKQLDASRSRDIPRSGAPAIVHGDFKLGNTLIAGGKVRAVLDWEMSTLGDPLTDLALFLLYGDEAIDLDSEEKGEMANPEEIVAHYAEATGRDVSRLGWYLGLACFKLAVIAEGIHFRYTQGLTVGEGFAEIGEHVGRLVARGLTEV